MKYEPLKPNKYYHIYNQGNNGEDIFLEAINYDYFLKLLKKHILPVADIWSYCLLKNHFHFLVQIKEVNEEKKISKSFSNFFNSYSKSINKKYNRSGSLFRDRFKRIKIEDEIYLKRLIIYINLNPIYHGFVKNLDDYKYVSYLSLISEKETLLKRKEVLSLFENKENFKHHIIDKQIEFNEKLKELILE
ncbi:MAG: transposase [Flavobacteriaceae bacterium]|nr:MAG: transposase [Flavobacteriaceae bacterium]